MKDERAGHEGRRIGPGIEPRIGQALGDGAIAGRGDEGRELAVRHRRLLDPEGRDLHPPGRGLLGHVAPADQDVAVVHVLEPRDQPLLAAALLLGLGAVAVGTYLNNNRRVTLSAPDRVVVTRADGSKVVTIRDADLRVLRRTLVRPDGTTTALIDETAQVAPVDVAALPPPARPVMVVPGEQLSEDALREALRRETQVDRTFTLGQIRNIPEVRALVAPVDIQAITFDTGSAAIKPDQAQALASLGRVIAEQIRQNPGEMFLIEGHTDTVGADAMNLALSDRRAESVALALTEFFRVPPENMVVQGYGEQFLKVAREGDVRANRRAAVRRITDLLARN